MEKTQIQFSNFIDRVCGEFACMEAAKPLQEGFRCLCESIHTARAIEVRKQFNLLMGRVNDWIKKEREHLSNGGRGDPITEPIFIAEHELTDLDWGDPDDFDFSDPDNLDKIANFDNGLTIRISLVPDEYNDTGAQYSVGMDLVQITIPDLAAEWMYECRRAKNAYLKDKAMRIWKMMQELKTSDRVNLDILDGVETLLNTGTAIEAITHELTHYVQEKCGEMPTTEEEVAKYGIKPEEYDPHLHHEFLPWEIDADVQGHIISFIRMNWLLSPNEMAKKIYDMFIHSKRNEGRIPEERRKQCWQTAASLARAVNLATERDGYDGAEEIIKHLDDYGV